MVDGKGGGLSMGLLLKCSGCGFRVSERQRVCLRCVGLFPWAARNVEISEWGWWVEGHEGVFTQTGASGRSTLVAYMATDGLLGYFRKSERGR